MLTIFNNPQELMKSDLQQFKEQLESITHPTPTLEPPPESTKIKEKSKKLSKHHEDGITADAALFDALFSDMPDFTARYASLSKSPTPDFEHCMPAKILKRLEN